MGYPFSKPDALSVAVERPVDRQLRKLFDSHFNFVGRVTRNLGVTAGDADDVVQKVFEIAMHRLADLKAGHEKAFLAQTAVRVCANHRRSEARHRVVSLDHAAAVADPSPSPEEATSQNRALAMLDTVLSALDDDLRSVFVLYEIEGFTMKEIAVALGLPHGTVASRLRRSRELFEGKLQAQSSPPLKEKAS